MFFPCSSLRITLTFLRKQINSCILLNIRDDLDSFIFLLINAVSADKNWHIYQRRIYISNIAANFNTYTYTIFYKVMWLNLPYPAKLGYFLSGTKKSEKMSILIITILNNS